MAMARPDAAAAWVSCVGTAAKLRGDVDIDAVGDGAALVVRVVLAVALLGIARSSPSPSRCC